MYIQVVAVPLRAAVPRVPALLAALLGARVRGAAGGGVAVPRPDHASGQVSCDWSRAVT